MNLAALRNELESGAGILAQLRRRAREHSSRVLLPETSDERVLMAGVLLKEYEIAQPILLGKRPPTGMGQQLERRLGNACWIDPAAAGLRGEITQHIWRRRRHRGMTQGQAHVLAAERLHFAASYLALDGADTMVAGAACATADVVRASLWCIGAAANSRTVGGTFLMVSPRLEDEPLMLADCAVVPEPTEEQLLQIAREAARGFRRCLGRWPAVAFLSFSTHGSAAHPAATRVRRAAAQLAAEEPQWNVQGEVQVDAALVPEVARTKGIDWGAQGRADLLIFPDLASGNIGSKLIERLGGWRAIGPVLQGLRRPVCDLSRGCSALDCIDAAALVAAWRDDRSG